MGYSTVVLLVSGSNSEESISKFDNDSSSFTYMDTTDCALSATAGK